MRIFPISSFDLPACASPADTARAAGCDSLTPLHFPGNAGSVVLEGKLSYGRRTCWALHIRAGQRLDLRLISADGDVAVEVWSEATHTTRPRNYQGFTASSSSSSSSVRRVTGGGETRVSIGVQWPGGEFVIAVTAVRGAASYWLEVVLR